jgi:3-hydroxybutyryl-CoA dehydrogenase
MADLETHRVAVAGSGTMGLGIAQVAAAAGFETVLYDIAHEQLDRALEGIRARLDRAAERGRIDASQRDATLMRLHTTDDLAAACVDAGVFIEAIPERIDLKLQLFVQLDQHLPPASLVATNTSALSVTELAGALKDPSRCIGLHFFNPVHRMKLVEVVRGLQTSDATGRRALDFCQAIGKETVEVNEAPGFVTTRVNALIGNEAFRMLQEGVASARDIDKALKLGLNHPMGPFELVDLVGLDTRLSILRFLHTSLGERFRPTYLQEQYVKAGRLGKKTGRGVYDYPQGD